MTNLSRFLAQVEPFSRLPQSEIERLASICQVVDYAKGETLYSEGESAAHVWILQSGRLEILKYNSGDRPLAIESIQPRQLFGTLCRLGTPATASYPCTAVAAVKSIAVRFPDRFFSGLYNHFPAVVLSTCQLCSARLGSLKERVATSLEPVQQRIARTLLQLKKSHGSVLPFTKREIAELAGTTVETTIRTLRFFEKKQWVASQRGQVTLKVAEAIQTLITTRTKGESNEHH